MPHNPSGILLVDKPTTISSAAVLRKIQKKFDIKKIGHGGTLDPFASGLLIVLFGEATKIANFLLTDEKSYLATISTEFSTDTGDHTGIVTQTNSELNSPAQWEKVKEKFLGKILQTPPQYSAIKVKGKPLYSYARKNQFIPIPPKEVTIHELKILSVKDRSVDFFVRSSGGTYIRTLGEEWAKAASSLGHLTSLRRTKVGRFSLENSLPLGELLEKEKLPPLLSIPEALSHIPQIICSESIVKKVQLGQQEKLREYCLEHLSNPTCPTVNHVLLTQKQVSSSLTEALALLAVPAFAIDRVFHSQQH